MADSLRLFVSLFFCLNNIMEWKESQEHANVWHTCTLWYSVRRAPGVNDQWINFQLKKFRHSTKSDVCKPKLGPTKGEKKVDAKNVANIRKGEKLGENNTTMCTTIRWICLQGNWNKIISSKANKTIRKSFFKSTATTCSACTFSIHPLGVTEIASTFVRIMFKVVDRRNGYNKNGSKKPK